MPKTELVEYIKTARSKQIPDAKIREMLITHGWAAADVDAAFAPVADTLDIPLPPVPRLSLWIGFEYVLLFITLYISATCVGGILHHAVDQWIKDPVRDRFDLYGYSSGWNGTLVRGYTAGIIVAYPIFMVLFVMIQRQIKKNVAIKNLHIRKILIYLTLVGTFILMISHLISTIYSFLNGSTTLNSFLHLLVTLLIAGSISAYLLHDVREDRSASV